MIELRYFPTIDVVASGNLVSGWVLVGYLVIATVLLLLNGAYVAYEFALLAAKRAEFAGDESGSRVSAAVDKSLSDLSMQLAGAQLGITMVSLGLGLVAEPAFQSLLDPIAARFLSEETTSVVGLVAALSIVIFLHLVFGEMVPKNLALTAPNQTMRWLVIPYRAYLWLFRPVALFLNAIANAGCRAVGIEPRDELLAVHSVSELSSILTVSSEEGAIEPDSAELLQGALTFSERSVVEIAVPLEERASVRLGATPAQLERVVAQSGQTRILVIGPKKTHQIVGYFHARDLVQVERSERMAPMPVSQLRQVIPVSSDRSLVEVLRTLRSRKRPFAVVVDEDRIPVGMVSIEEIVAALIPAEQSAEELAG